MRLGGYYDPRGFQDARGPVGDAAIHPRALRADKVARLWDLSEELVGFDWGETPKKDG